NRPSSPTVLVRTRVRTSNAVDWAGDASAERPINPGGVVVLEQAGERRQRWPRLGPRSAVVGLQIIRLHVVQREILPRRRSIAELVLMKPVSTSSQESPPVPQYFGNVVNVVPDVELVFPPFSGIR